MKPNSHSSSSLLPKCHSKLCNFLRVDRLVGWLVVQLDGKMDGRHALKTHSEIFSTQYLPFHLLKVELLMSRVMHTNGLNKCNVWRPTHSLSPCLNVHLLHCLYVRMRLINVHAWPKLSMGIIVVLLLVRNYED
jgi:hypothetical protein